MRKMLLIATATLATAAGGCRLFHHHDRASDTHYADPAR
jgi:hypothetical protein